MARDISSIIAPLTEDDIIAVARLSYLLRTLDTHYRKALYGNKLLLTIDELYKLADASEADPLGQLLSEELQQKIDALCDTAFINLRALYWMPSTPMTWEDALELSIERGRDTGSKYYLVNKNHLGSYILEALHLLKTESAIANH